MLLPCIDRTPRYVWLRPEPIADNVGGQDRRQFALLTGHGNIPRLLHRTVSRSERLGNQAIGRGGGATTSFGIRQDRPGGTVEPGSDARRSHGAGASVLLGRRCLNGLFIADVVLRPL